MRPRAWAGALGTGVALWAALIAAALVIAGCGATPPAPPAARIPVPADCPSPRIAAPAPLPIRDLPEGADTEARARYLAATIEALAGRAEACEAQLRGYVPAARIKH